MDMDDVAELTDKALRFDLDQLGIELREREAVELVELRARLASLSARNAKAEKMLSEARCSCNALGACLRCSVLQCLTGKFPIYAAIAAEQPAQTGEMFTLK